MKSNWRGLFVAAFLTALSGCGVSTTTDVVTPGKPTSPMQPSGSEPVPSDQTTSDSGEESPPTAPAETVSLIEDDGPKFQQFLAENKGKVILVDCWATWCAPCKAGFPDTVALYEKYKDQGLVVVSISFDDMGEEEEEKKKNREDALAFLKAQNATFTNFFATTGVSSESGTPFGVEISLPAFRLIDREGKDRIPANVKPDEVHEMLAELVKTVLAEGK